MKSLKTELEKAKDLLLKRVGIDINELNGFYKKIVIDSEFYKNLCDIKKLEKKNN